MTGLQYILETECGSEEDFLKLALSYGSPIKSRENGHVIDTLVTQTEDEVAKDSLSKRYGLNPFPIHTDCAYLREPPKYILLRYVGTMTNPTPTVIVDFDISKLTDEEIEFVRLKTWFVRGKNIGFYSTILKDNILRYDKEVMKLVNSNDDQMQIILKKMEQRKICWSPNKVAIINNYSVLHYRPKVPKEQHKKRILQRINII